MNFNALLLAMIILHSGTFFVFYDNTPWLPKAYSFNYSSVHLRSDPTGEKVGRWDAVSRQTDCFPVVCFN